MEDNGDAVGGRKRHEIEVLGYDAVHLASLRVGQ
jgi:hypothetical protein